MPGANDDDPTVGAPGPLAATVFASEAAGETSPARSPEAALQAGDAIGRYHLRRLLGAGAMGVVWEANDPTLGRAVAIKVVHPGLASVPDAAARMLREARAMAQVRDPGVVVIHDAGEVDGLLFLAMELVRGTTLGATLRERAPIALADWRHSLALMRAAGRGLAAAHAAGVLHRDFKPDNVLVETGGRVCVGDFGLASLGAPPRARPTTARLAVANADVDLTTTGALLGTPAYMSPEQLRGEVVDARADQFSFAVATYEALYGERPFLLGDAHRGNLGAIVDAITAQRIHPPPVSTSVPAALRAVVLRGLAASPSERWPTLTSMLDALDGAAQPPRRRRRMVLGMIGLVAALAAGIVALAWPGAKQNSPPRGPHTPPTPR
ncbi:hypothetical protein BH11MYX1_BH11MYX1_19440 [soil metagenome]